jgi:hypothetical protein
MTLPIHARVEAAPNFISNLEAAHLFFVEQDTDSASERFRKLKSELREMVNVLSWSPASGHTARFFSGRSAQARLRAQTVQQLATQAGLPHLREYLVSRHIVLYAHSETEVVLLALKHQRQLTYLAEG